MAEEKLGEENTAMQYISTRGGVKPMSFTNAVMSGLADDGGLILPREAPDVTGCLDEWQDLEYAELAEAIIRLYSDLDQATQRTIIQDSYRQFRSPEVAPVRKAGDIFMLELFHGPTLAFKDIALQFLGRVFEHILRSRSEQMNVLGATSGDTGSAAIYGVKGRERMSIFILHPEGRVSPVQERQMTTVSDENVHNLAVGGTFDDCQRIAKEIFCDLDFKKRHRLGSVNSINWARLLPQIVYYFYAFFAVRKETGCENISFSVPTGNFGDIFAGYMAHQMGLPIRQLILATNENDILHRFFSTGIYGMGSVKPTLSPSMDIQVASNFERYLYYRMGSEPDRVREAMDNFKSSGEIRIKLQESGAVDPLIVSGRSDDETVLETIRDFHADYGYLLDPHSAVGVGVAKSLASGDAPLVCLATAHPAKFPEAIKRATGNDIAHHSLIDALKNKPSKVENVPPETMAVKNYIAALALG